MIEKPVAKLMERLKEKFQINEIRKESGRWD